MEPGDITRVCVAAITNGPSPERKRREYGFHFHETDESSGQGTPSLALRARTKGNMPDLPLAYFITWTTYGTWLPGDDRGWVQKGRFEIQAPNAERQELAQRWLRFDPVILTIPQREVVARTIIEHCEIRSWFLHAKNVRTNHVHVVVTSSVEPETIRDQLKSWSSRRLNEAFGKQPVWWTVKGSIRWIWDDESLENVIWYVTEGQ
jgi:REP element-mobilizing transposase RayT